MPQFLITILVLGALFYFCKEYWDNREERTYESATKHLNKKGQIKLAGYVENGYEVKSVNTVTIIINEKLKKEGRCIILMPDGTTYIGKGIPGS